MGVMGTPVGDSVKIGLDNEDQAWQYHAFAKWDEQESRPLEKTGYRRMEEPRAILHRAYILQ